MTRRSLLNLLPGGIATGFAMSALPAHGQAGPSPSGLSLYDVKRFGAVGNGNKLDSAAINRAIDACTAAGGGIVYVPPGIYLCGTVELKSRVTLYLEAGATLLGSLDIDDYTRREGPPLEADANQRHLVFARDAVDVGLAGPGLIDGRGSHFWEATGRVLAPEDSWRLSATYAWKPIRVGNEQKRASPMLEFVGCKGLHIEDVRIENSAGWTLRPVNCDNVFIRGITIKNPVVTPNGDGIDPTGCQNVMISDCLIDTADDVICLKSENPYGGEIRVTKNVTITNCIFRSCCNGLKLGTSSQGGFENIAFTNSVIFSENVAPMERVISGVAVEMVDGGWLEGVVVSNIRMQNVRTPIFVRRAKRHARPDGTPGTLRGVMIENIHATGSIVASSVSGLPGFDAEDVTLSNIRIDTADPGDEAWVNREMPELPEAYPESRMFGRMPSYGLYCRHVRGLRLRNVEIGAPAAEPRPAIICDDVKDLDVDGFRPARVRSSQPVVKLINTTDGFFRGCTAPDGANPFLRVEGSGSGRISVAANDFTRARSAVSAADDVPATAIRQAGNLDPA